MKMRKQIVLDQDGERETDLEGLYTDPAVGDDCPHDWRLYNDGSKLCTRCESIEIVF